MLFKEFLKKFRIEKNFSQTGLADFLGFHYNTISRWERGLQLPENDQLQKISLHTGVSYVKLWIMTHKDDAPYILPVFTPHDLKNAIDHIPAPSDNKKSFCVLVDKTLEKQSGFVFKTGSYLLVDPHQNIESGNWVFSKGKLKKAKRKQTGMRVTFCMAKV